MSKVIEKIMSESPTISDITTENKIRELLRQLESVLNDNINGDIVSFGYDQRVSSTFISKMLKGKKSKKNFYVYDSFKGLPKASKEDENTCFSKGELFNTKEELEKRFDDLSIKKPIIKECQFNKIDCKELPINICFVFLNGYFYNPTNHSLIAIYNRMSIGGRIIIDNYSDPRLPGVRQACLDFLKNKTENPISLPKYGYGAAIVCQKLPEIKVTNLLRINFDQIKNKTPHSICLAIMVKDEEKRISITLNSVIPHVDAIYVLDTGSTDNTINIITSLCKTSNIPFSIFHSDFIDYGKNRNILLNQIHEDNLFEYILMLDANDELVNGQFLKEAVANNPVDMYSIDRHLYSKSYSANSYTSPLMKSSKTIIYEGPIHEYLTGFSTSIDVNDFHLYQDRDFDDYKTSLRRVNEIDILKKQYAISLCNKVAAQLLAAFFASGKYKEAYNMFKKEKHLFLNRNYLFIICYYLALCAENAGIDSEKVISLYINAWEVVSMNTSPRIEPLVELSRIYINKGSYNMAYLFAKEACKYDYPDTLCPEDLSFLIDQKKYNYFRWNYLYVSAYRMGDFGKSKKALEKCINSPFASEYDHKQKSLFFKGSTKGSYS